MRICRLSLVIIAGVAGIVGVSELGSGDGTATLIITSVVLYTWILDEIFLKDWEDAYKREAATIQEAFDCFVFELAWPAYKDIAYPTRDRIKHLANKTSITGILRDWYTLGAIPDDLTCAIAHCQKMNCWWDKNLRHTWQTLLVWTSLVLVAAIVVIAVLSGITVAKLLVGLACTLRVSASLFAEIRNQKSTTKRVGRLHEYLSQCFKTHQPSISILRNVQDEIFEHRCSNPPVPEFLYKLKKDAQETEAARK